MAFWGVLVNPGTPYTLQRDGAPKRLRISQATLGEGSWYSKSRSIVRCSVGSKPPVYICALSIKDVYSHQLDLEFEESEDIVFSVSGVRGVYLTGYYLNSNPNTAITTTTVSDDPHKPLLHGLEDIEEAKNELPSHNSEGNKHALNHGLIDDCTVNFLPTLDEPPSIEGIVELTDGKEMDSGDFDVHKVVNNVVTEQETKSSDLQKEEVIDEKTERIVYQTSISTMPNTSLPPGNVCKLKEKKSEESMIHDTIPKCNQDKVVDYSDCETLKDQGYARLPLFPEKRESAFLGRKRDGNAILKRKNRAPKEDGSLSEQIGHESNTPKPNRTKSSLIGVKSRQIENQSEL
ncbi:hypothetical protein Acr_00g0068520 [Actinidia rufa]|uniref:peptidylprolyl isomerase n=1 Tax=Actinidia rufa TaxID=165716 RepID=A0A7J0DS56_9ERIC|nr:hypothetical protein Acr_00g0068520 [Actinidia rufa]